MSDALNQPLMPSHGLRDIALCKVWLRHARKAGFSLFQLSGFRKKESPPTAWQLQPNPLTLNDEQIDAIYAKGRNLAIGIRKGEYKCGIDIDDEVGKREFHKRFKGKTLSIRTPRGETFYFKTKRMLPAFNEAQSAAIGHGKIGNRVDGKYGVAVGSQVDEHAYPTKKDGTRPMPEGAAPWGYYPLDTVPVAEMPEDLFDWLAEAAYSPKPAAVKQPAKPQKKEKKPTAEAAPHTPTPPPPAATAFVEEGGRHERLLSWIGAVLNKNIRPDLARATAHFLNRSYVKVPLPTEEVDRMFNSTLAADQRARPEATRDVTIYTPPRSGKENDVAKRLKAIGVKVRWNLRAVTPELRMSDQDEWKTLKSPQFEMLLSAVEKYVVTAPFVTPKEPRRVKGMQHTPVSDNAFRNCIMAIAGGNEVDPFLEKLRSLPKWDGENRLESVLFECFTVDDEYKELAKFAIKSFMMACVKRAIEPGAKYDLVPVIIGEEGLGKSTFWAELAMKKEWFFDGFELDAKNKEQFEGMAGHVIIELAELNGLGRADINKLNALITRTTDKVRPAYGRGRVDVPRTVCLCGTTNDTEHLPIGINARGRRWLPIVVSRKDGDKSYEESMRHMSKYITANVIQMWAEALHRVKARETFHLPHALEAPAASVVRKHKTKNILLEDKIDAYLAKDIVIRDGFTLTSIMESLEINNPMQWAARVAESLKGRGYFQKSVVITEHGNIVKTPSGKAKRQQLWFPAEAHGQ